MKNVLVVYKRSAFELYSESNDEQTSSYVKSDKANAREMLESHQKQLRSRQIIIDAIQKKGIDPTLVSRRDVTPYLQNETYDLIICIGGDGTFMEISQLARGATMWGINADPDWSVGFYMSSNAKNFKEHLEQFERLPRTNLPRGQVTINSKKIHECFINNALIANTDPMSTVRYLLDYGNGQQSYRGRVVCLLQLQQVQPLGSIKLVAKLLLLMIRDSNLL